MSARKRDEGFSRIPSCSPATQLSSRTSAVTNVRAQIHHVDGHDICRVQVDPSGFPVDATVIKQKPDGPKEQLTEYYVRRLNGTVALDVVEKQKYIAQRWPATPDTLTDQRLNSLSHSIATPCSAQKWPRRW